MAGEGGAQPVSAKPKRTSEARAARRRRAGLRPDPAPCTGPAKSREGLRPPRRDGGYPTASRPCPRRANARAKVMRCTGAAVTTG